MSFWFNYYARVASYVKSTVWLQCHIRHRHPNSYRFNNRPSRVSRSVHHEVSDPTFLTPPNARLLFTSSFSSVPFIPTSSSTPKKVEQKPHHPYQCSTPRSHHARFGSSRCAPRPIDCSTPNKKHVKKSAVPDLHQLLLPTINSMQHSTKIWVL